MTYYDIFNTTKFTGSELKQASDILKATYPNGPRIHHTEKVVGDYSFNEIANHIHKSYQEVSKSLHS
jgi:hypothetical protein